MGLVGRAFEPVAAGFEDLFPLDGDVADGFSRVGLQQAAFVGYATAHRRVEHGLYEKHPVEHAGHGTAAGFRLDTVVQALVACRCVGIRHARAVRREAVGCMHTGTCCAGKNNGFRNSQDQNEYAKPNEHCSKIT